MNATHLFQGCGTALVTPFAPGGAVDEAAYRKFIRFQIEQGINFLVPCGTTGETPTLSRDEHLRLVRIAVEEAKAAPRRVPVLAGAGGNNTAHVAELARALETLGADGVLSVAPYYNKPTQEGLFQHFSAVAAAVKLPVVLYNVPGRTCSNIEAATALRLAQVGNIVAVKEASGNLTQIGAILAAAPAKFAVISGDDALTLPMLALGAQGLISVASNLIPGPMSEMVRLGLAGDYAKARSLHFEYLPLMEVNFIESSPGPVKCGLARMGHCQEVYRLPMVPVGEASRRRVFDVMQKVGL
ncbi:MAG TPA: 4-hydroxy-tetrahydrodipicolinate synthase [Terriglobales bacterium]|nr:4-hydroxy-tetrahydrodipicolinate synthase [Terriglobales bacterium]